MKRLLIFLGIFYITLTTCKKENNDLAVTTTAISNIATASAKGGGNVLSDGGIEVTAKGICWSTLQNPTTSDSKTTDGTGTGKFISILACLSPNTTYYIKAYATNSSGTIYGSEVSFTTLDSQAGMITDIDGNNYKTVTIGTQIWMAENLKTTRYNNGSNIPLVVDNTTWSNLTSPAYCWYNNDEGTYKVISGALYTWHTVNTDLLCPTGWHVPTEADWTTLQNYLIANGYNYDGTTIGNKIAKALAATTNWVSTTSTGAVGNTDYPLKRNSTGFTAFSCGYRNGKDGLFWGMDGSIGDSSFWWSATESGASYGRGYYINYINLGLTMAVNYKRSGCSVRCVRD